MTTFTDAALRADALNLGPHWVYDQAALAMAFPNGVTEPRDPISPYHPNRKAGQYTHIGDQTKFLADATQGGYSRAGWKEAWLTAMQSYDGYLDGATKATLETQAETPSSSNEFSVISRIAPIIDLGLNLDETIAIAQDQAALTHGGDLIPEGVEFFVRVLFAVREGVDIEDAIYDQAESGRYPKLKPAEAYDQAYSADKTAFLEVAKEFGQACGFDSAFPLTLYFAINFSKSMNHAMTVNALAGGDTTARAMVLAQLIHARDHG